MEYLMNNGNGKKKDWVRLLGLYQQGDILVSNNVGKRIDEDKFTGENSIRLRVGENKFKNHHFLKGNSNDPDCHLIIERKHMDDLITYLEIVRNDYDERIKSK